MEWIEHVTGPSGGLFALGVAAGYLFAMRTVLAEAKGRIKALEERVATLQDDLLTEVRKN